MQSHIPSTRVCEIFKGLDRSYFIDDEQKMYSDYDVPLPIGCGQTISQPSLVAQMIDILDVDSSHKALEIGTGSGYQTAFLSRLAGHVYTVEVIDELAERAREKLQTAGYSNIFYKIGDGSKGWANHAPYDRIIASAASSIIPPPLIEQLADDGRMLIPVGEKGLQDLVLLIKDSQGKVTQQVIEKVRFVEFTGEFGWQ